MPDPIRNYNNLTMADNDDASLSGGDEKASEFVQNDDPTSEDDNVDDLLNSDGELIDEDGFGDPLDSEEEEEEEEVPEWACAYCQNSNPKACLLYTSPSPRDHG